jgi:hypothetical protein
MMRKDTEIGWIDPVDQLVQHPRAAPHDFKKCQKKNKLIRRYLRQFLPFEHKTAGFFKAETVSTL